MAFSIGNIKNGIATGTIQFSVTFVDAFVLPRNDALAPVWKLPDSQSKAIKFTVSANIEGDIISNDIYVWYGIHDGQSYLYYSTAPAGTPVRYPCPLSADILSIEFILNSDSTGIVVGTVDPLVDRVLPPGHSDGGPAM